MKPERGEQMGVRVARTAEEAGVPAADRARLARIHAAAMAIRSGRAADDHDPAYLHPGRSALILLQDVGETDADVLGAAMAVDSQTPDWAPNPGDLADPGVEALALAVPPSGAEDLAERLVVGDDRLRRVALAERLDHLRHAHLWPDLDARRAAHSEAAEVYARVAARTHPVLARRYAWWCRMFGARHLR